MYGLDDVWGTWSEQADQWIDKMVTKHLPDELNEVSHDIIHITMALSAWVAKLDFGTLYATPYTELAFIHKAFDARIILRSVTDNSMALVNRADIFSYTLLKAVSACFMPYMLGGAKPIRFYEDSNRLWCDFEDGNRQDLALITIQNVYRPGAINN